MNEREAYALPDAADDRCSHRDHNHPRHSIMSNEEIIRKWKSGASENSPKAPEGGEAPANPAGNGDLNDEQLEKVAGGLGGTEWIWSLGCCPG
jgi:mersacidin/lichenicidin family type 2 lantibiotic